MSDVVCDGGGDANGDHCCYLDGVACPFLVVDGPTGRRFACGLRTELGSWDAVHADRRYLEVVQPVWDWSGVIVSCGEWDASVPGQCCFARGD